VCKFVGFNEQLDTQQIISETSLSRQSIALVPTSKQQQRRNTQNVK